MLLEADQGALERRFAQLPVGDQDAGLGNQAAQELRHRRQRADPVVHEIDLPLPREFVPDGLRDAVRIEGHDVGLDGHSVPRRGLDHRHVADAGKRHVEGARNRRRGHRQVVHLGRHRLQPLLGGYAETLFLVHDQQSQIAEGDVLRQQAVGADDDVHGPVPHPRRDQLLLFRGAEPGEERHPDREGSESRFEDPRVLRGQHRGRNQDGDLLPVHRRLERGPERDFRLSEADVTGQQPVHGGLGLHVLEHVADRPRLVLGLGPFEGVLELLHARRVAGKRVAGRSPARRVEPDEFARDVAHGLRDALPPPDPARAPQPVERRRSRPRAGRVLLEQVQPVHRQEELRALRVVDFHQFRGALAFAEARHADETPDPVVGVDHRVAGFQIAEVRKEARGTRPPPGHARRRGHHGGPADHLQ